MEYITEDSIQCLLFSCVQNSKGNYNEKYWADLCEQMNSTVESFSQEYIWHRDKFRFNVPIILDKNNSDTPPHLTSITCFGDNIEDEWFILYLVLEITKINSDVIVQIKDNDGDFILIEAADYIPKWANPDTTVNRVYVYRGHIHLIPPESISLDTNLSICDALDIVVKSPDSTQVVASIENTILDRIGNYPQKIKENIYEAIVNIPVDLAALLTLDPNLIAPIVTTYCSHDPLEAKACRNIDFNDCIETKVKFTKCLYSMLIHSKLINSIYSRKNDRKSNILGLKLNYGLHMILRSGKDIFSTKTFANFLRSLKSKGYFKDNIEGSKEYNKLLETAKIYFSNNECSVNLQTYDRIKHLISADEFLSIKEKLIVGSSNSVLTEDSDEWLNIGPDDLNELLNKRYGKQVKYQNHDIVTAQTITNELSNFMKKTSDFEGIETNNDESFSTNDIDFEADKFSECINKFLNLLVSGNSDDVAVESDDSDGMKFSDNYETESDLDKEVRKNLSLDENYDKNENILKNIIQSMKEEKSSQGPSSTLLNSVGINKNDILDSDDDEE